MDWEQVQSKFSRHDDRRPNERCPQGEQHRGLHDRLGHQRTPIDEHHPPTVNIVPRASGVVRDSPRSMMRHGSTEHGAAVSKVVETVAPTRRLARRPCND